MDGTGFISEGNLKDVMGADFVGSFAALIDEVDTEGDGQISMAEFTTMMLEQTPSTVKPSPASPDHI